MADFEIDLDNVNVSTINPPAEGETAAVPVSTSTTPTTTSQETTVDISMTQAPASTNATESNGPSVKASGTVKETTFSHDEDHEEGEWGVASIDAPIFMMTPDTVEQFLQTSFNHQAPKLSKGLTQGEADLRLVSIP